MLFFQIRNLVDEIRVFKDLAEPFLDKASLYPLDGLREDLESLRDRKEGRAKLRLYPPVKTLPSPGKYEVCGRKGGSRTISGRISGQWDVQVLGPHGNTHKLTRELQYAGVASTLVELLEGDTIIAAWKMEVGGRDHPGCLFHSHVIGEDGGSTRFPRDFPIPRLPNLFLTPMSVGEYVLSELFQDEWTRRVMEGDNSATHWRTMQRNRLSLLFEYQRRVVDQAVSSPWVALKTAKPEGDDLRSIGR
jgi:hypothetical protein